MLRVIKLFLIVVLALSSFFSGRELVEKVYAAPSDVGKWSDVQQWPRKPVHVSLMPNGKVIAWPSFNNGDNPIIWDPETNNFEKATKAGYNIFCSGHTTMADGKIFVAGGHVHTPTGLPTASIYDPETDRWTRVPDMNKARWYPSVLPLSNGNILVASGMVKKGEKNNTPQVFNISTNRWRTLNGATSELPLYPWMFQAPNGKVFIAGSNNETRYLNTTGDGDLGPIIRTSYGRRKNGTAVMFSPGKVLIIGGGEDKQTPTRTAEVINLNADNPDWRYTGSMEKVRRHANSTLLPNGFVLVTGGTWAPKDDPDKAIHLAEWWNPGTGNWTQLSRNQVYRGYHSMALLLPDGRVLVAGGEKSGRNAEIFSPPYLFKGERPKITKAPREVNYGDKFFVETPDADKIEAVRWIRLGSVTHSFNMSQRINNLDFVKKENGLEVKSIVNANNATPGYYMLFILKGNGVPSVAKIVRLGNISTSLSTVEQPGTDYSTTVDPNVEGHHDHEDINIE